MKKTLSFLAAAALTLSASAQNNPVVQTWFTTDPAPMVHGDRLYIYTGHDEDNADFFWMQEWRVYSTADMVNWQDHGSPLAIEDFSWGDDRAWAPQCIERNGKFYLYVPLHSKLSGTMAIGVAVSKSPTGPFVDPIGKPLADGSWDYIDPTVFIDDDGQAWLFWGNPQIYYARLNPDMISFADGVHKLTMDEEGFGSPQMKERKRDVKYRDSYTEGPWIFKRNGKYYLLYAAGGIPEHISYSTADSPTGPWHYQGIIMPQQETNSFTNHSGVIDFKGHSYFFYHTGWLPRGGGFGRSVSVEEFKYNADGSFPTINATREGVAPIATFSPYGRHEAEIMNFSSGLKSQPNGTANVYLSELHNGDWMRLRNVDFGTTKPARFRASVASALRGGTIELRADSIGGQLIATVPVPHTGGWEKWKTVETRDVNVPQGIHDLYFVFRGRKGPELFSFDWWEMK